MKKSLLNIALATVASAAFAATQTVNFNWSAAPTTVDTQVTTVPAFTAAGTLTGVQINLTGQNVVGTAVASNLGNQSSQFSIDLSGTHTVTINGVPIANVIAATSGDVTAVNGGPSVNLGPISAALSGSAPGGLSGWTSPVPVFIRFNGTFGVNATPQVQLSALPTLSSVGIGTVTYTYTEGRVPEAETYVAGLALVGMVGYGFYRRSRKA